ncbi:hypothetical protein FNL55_18405 [Tardiphaga sp. vice352]|uniref:hypothetical protein n=1 Tax=unclassified Tardiphaga TaxID=2631404 RepID=UPI0011655FC4|nr:MULTISPECIES: hypothetical protein [unclassified Tardiphaga]QDM17749.1 hypothetical protein FNL53_18690 [Tardiphaga sp. vice278]QDM27968.1 hypothetical protein FNL56_18930 [Tardiphaga sp. vice304]QDM33111.1 hypothetical protein FNL55_18405 [Tardiphaga sp. vice352]
MTMSLIDISSPFPATMRRQGLDVTGFCCRNVQLPADFSGTSLVPCYELPSSNAYRAGPALASILFHHAFSGMNSKSSQDSWQLRSTK